MLDLKLATFLSLCETRNYTQTASLLNITQPAVSQHIKYLENYYQTKLFYYDEKRRLHLTDKGKILQSFARTIRADSAIVLERLSAPPEKTIELKLGTVTTAGESLVPHMIAEYLKIYPDKNVSLFLGEADDLLTWLQEGRIHCCITDAYCPSNSYESEELCEVETVCVCSPKNPLAGQTVEFTELNNYSLIFRENDTNSHRNLMRILQDHNQELENFRSYIEIGTINAVKKLVMENIGISFIYRFVVQENLDNGTLAQIYIKHFSSRNFFSFAWMKNSFFTPSNLQFLEVCKRTLL